MNKMAAFTEGSVLRHVVVMTCTSTTSLLSIFLVDIFTVVYIGILRDDSLLAALVLAKTLLFFITSMVLGIAVGAGAVIAKSTGAGAHERSKQFASTGFVLVMAVAAVGAALELLCLDRAIGLLGAHGDALQSARSYLRITLPATLLMAIGQMCAQVLRTAGYSRQAMWILLVATAAVAVADPLFIFGFRLGLDGAGYAYVVSCAVSAALGLYYVLSVAGLTSKIGTAHFAADTARIARVAFPAVVGNLATPVALAYLMASMAQFGAQALAGVAVVDRITQFAFCVLFVLPGALSPVIGQNLGATRRDRVEDAIKASFAMVVAYGAVVSIVLALAANLLCDAFHMEGEGRVILLAFSRFGGVLWTLIGLQFIAISIFITMRRAIYVTLFGWLRATLGTIPFVWYGARAFGGEGAVIGQLVGNALVALAAFVMSMLVMQGALKEMSSERGPGALPDRTG